MDSEKKYKFKVGEKVFAKVKGHPHWPAFISCIDTTTKIPKYNVIFYGTREHAWIKEIDVCAFLKNKSRYGLPNKKNNKGLAKAMSDAEKSLNSSYQANNSPLPLNNTSIRKDYTEPSQILSVGCSSPLNTSDSSNLQIDLNFVESNITPRFSIPSEKVCHFPYNNDGKQEIPKASYTKIPLAKDAATNTSVDIDLNFQLEALTDKCISLEKSIMDEKSVNLKLSNDLNSE